jgi:hypothetical protein
MRPAFGYRLKRRLCRFQVTLSYHMKGAEILARHTVVAGHRQFAKEPTRFFDRFHLSQAVGVLGCGHELSAQAGKKLIRIDAFNESRGDLLVKSAVADWNLKFSASLKGGKVCEDKIVTRGCLHIHSPTMGITFSGWPIG